LRLTGSRSLNATGLGTLGWTPEGILAAVLRIGIGIDESAGCSRPYPKGRRSSLIFGQPSDYRARCVRPPPHQHGGHAGQASRLLGFRIVDGVAAAVFPQKSSHSAVFAQIDPAGSRLSHLARGANMSPRAMGELVAELESWATSYDDRPS
jgi:hypothetical protein